MLLSWPKWVFLTCHKNHTFQSTESMWVVVVMLHAVQSGHTMTELLI